MKRHRFNVISDLICSECGTVMYVPRSRDKKRGAGHIKHMYCPSCQKVTEHTEKGEW